MNRDPEPDMMVVDETVTYRDDHLRQFEIGWLRSMVSGFRIEALWSGTNLEARPKSTRHTTTE